jgi:D-arabinose 1-dehydrogenase-like Zn-dependent alcohol dehydrogenase
VAAVRELTHGGAHVSVDALGIAASCRNSVLSLRKRGRHLQLGHTTRVEQGEIAVPIDVMVLNELQMIGAFGMQGQRFGQMLAMVEAGRLKPGAVVSRTVGLEQVSDVLASMGSYDTTGLVVIDQF